MTTTPGWINTDLLQNTNFVTSLGFIIEGDASTQGLKALLEDGETNIKDTISALQAVSATDLTQADLLAAQEAIQSWSLVSGMVTGLIRAVGDGLSKTVQNIR